MTSALAEHTKNDIKELFSDENVYDLVIQQLEEIAEKCISIICIYKKIFVKIKNFPKNSPIHIEEHDYSLWLIRISKSFPLEKSVRLFLLEGCYQPRIFDTRDYVKEVLGKQWSWKNRLNDIFSNITEVQDRLIKRNEQYLTLQRTGEFRLGETFIYNQLQEHTSLSIFVDRSKDSNNSTLIGVSQTHLLTFKKVTKKFKTKQEQDYELKSKTLYGKKYILTRYCELQCIDMLNVNSQTKQIGLRILKYKSIKSFNEYQSITRKFIFNQDQHTKFIRCILKSITKFQPMKVDFMPSLYEKDKIELKQDSLLHKIIELNELENRLETSKQSQKKQDILNRLNKSYQKLIEYYSARANPYYLIYVNKLNWLYNKYFMKDKQGNLSAIYKSKKDLLSSSS